MALRTNTIEYALTSLTTDTKAFFDSVFIWNGSTYADETTDAASSTTGDVALSGTLNSEWYFGNDLLFSGFNMNHSSNGTTGVLVWEYSKGSGTWGTLTKTLINNIGNDRLVAGVSRTGFVFDPPSDWATDTVNSATRYWIRARVTTAYGVTPTGDWAMKGEYATFSQQTLYIPETTDRAIKSAIIEVTARDASTGGASFAGYSGRLKLGSNAYTTRSASRQVIAGSVRDLVFLAGGKVVSVGLDFTSNFVSNFGNSSSQTANFQFSYMNDDFNTGGNVINNITAKLIITYEFNDTATTRIKTVRIPLESPTTTLTNTLAEIGTNQVPNLDTFLPEASKTYRDIFFQFESLEARANTTDFQLCLALDSEAEHQDGLHEAAQTYNPTYRYLWKRTDMATNSTHAFKARSTLTGRFVSPSVLLVVTYEYNEADTTSVINSIALPFSAPGLLKQDTIPRTFKIDFPIQEPSTITLVQSGIQFISQVVSGGSNNVLLKSGSQSYRTYTVASTVSQSSGYYTCTQRIDSNGVQGAGVTLARGLNNIVEISAYRTTTSGNRYCGLGGVVYLNYTSGKSALKTAAHNKSIYFMLSENKQFVIDGDDGLGNSNISYSFGIADVNYYLHNNSLAIKGCGEGATTQGELTPVIEAKTNEFDGQSYYSGKNNVYLSSSNRRFFTESYINLDNLFKTHPTDPSGKMDMATSRQLMVANWGLLAYLYGIANYHSITYTASGTVSGYTGDGSGITVELHRKDTDELVGRVTTTTGGSYTFTWYDNTMELYGHARQDGTHLGRSDDTLAS